MSNNNPSWPTLLLGGIATVAAITSAGYIYNKLIADGDGEALPIEERGEREEDEMEAEIRRQVRKANPERLSKNRKLSLIAKLDVLIKDLDKRSKSENRMVLMKKPIDEIQQLIQGEPSFRDGVYDPDIIYILSGMYAIIGDFGQQRKCLEKCAEKFDSLSMEYLTTCQKLVTVCVILMDFEASNKWAGCNLESWKGIIKHISSTQKNHFDLANSHASYAITLMRIGRFKESFENFKEALQLYKYVSPVHEMCLSALKNYFATLLASGDVATARSEGDRYLCQLQEVEATISNKNLKSQYIDFIIQVYHTFGCLLRNDEHFEFAAEYLERGEKYARSTVINIPLQLLVDSANVYWELENSEKASEKEKQVRDFKIHDGFKAMVPLSRSKYIHSTFAVLLENYYFMKIQLVARSEATRKEGVHIGTAVPVVHLTFKEKATFNVTFENPEGTFVQQFFLEEGQTELVIQSSIMKQKAEIYQFYKVVIQISDNEGNTLGMHHQLVLSPNPADVNADSF